jgi:hypothetical protein
MSFGFGRVRSMRICHCWMSCGAGCRNGAELWRLPKARDFRGSLRVVVEWATRRRRAERVSDRQLQKVPLARTIARLMATARDHMSKSDTVIIAAVEAGMPMLVDARGLINRFHTMIRKKAASDLESWITDANTSLIAANQPRRAKQFLEIWRVLQIAELEPGALDTLIRASVERQCIDLPALQGSGRGRSVADGDMCN